MFKKIYIGILISILFAGIVFAGNVPLLINYRGKATSSGSPINGPTSVQFKIFNTKTGGILLWDSGGEIVNAVNGVFNYTLGTNTGNPLSPSIFTNEFLYLEITLAGELLSPRERIVSVGYAINSAMVGGMSSTNFASKLHNHDNQYIGTNTGTMSGYFTNKKGIFVGFPPGMEITDEEIRNLDSGNKIKLNDSMTPSDDVQFYVNDDGKEFLWVNDNFGSPETIMRLYYDNMSLFNWILTMRPGAMIKADAIRSDEIYCTNYKGSDNVSHYVGGSGFAPANLDFYVNNTTWGGNISFYAGDMTVGGNVVFNLGQAGMVGGNVVFNLGGPGWGSVTINGDLNVAGTVTKGGGSFLIDHPLDPKNKILQHSFVEAPQRLNIYTGRAKMKDGKAVINLSDYFDALNDSKKSRISLTPINGWSPLYLDGKIKNNQFLVKTTKNGNPQQEFDWVIYTERNDAWARKHPLIVEQEKGKGNKFKKGKYLHPKAWEKK